MLVLEVSGERRGGAGGAADVGARLAPEGRVGGDAGENVGRCVGVLPGPDLDVVFGPLHGVDTAGGALEGGIAGVGGGLLLDATALAGPLGGLVVVVVVALGSQNGAGEERRVGGEGAFSGAVGVQRDGVVVLKVPRLVDVELAAVRPVGAVHPESRPCTAGGAGEVGKVCNKETLVEGVDALESCRLTAGADVAGTGGVVDTQAQLVVGYRDEVAAAGLVDVLDKTVAQIWVRVEGELVQEVGGIVCLVEDIGGRGRGGNGEDGGHRGKPNDGRGHVRGFDFVLYKINECEAGVLAIYR